MEDIMGCLFVLLAGNPVAFVHLASTCKACRRIAFAADMSNDTMWRLCCQSVFGVNVDKSLVPRLFCSKKEMWAKLQVASSQWKLHCKGESSDDNYHRRFVDVASIIRGNVWCIQEDGKRNRLYCASDFPDIAVLHLSKQGQSHMLVHQMRGHRAAVFSLAISADRSRLYSGSADNTIREWDCDSPDYTCLRTYNLSEEVAYVQSTDSTLYAACYDGHAYAFDLQSGDEIGKTASDGSILYDLQLSSDEKRLYTCSEQGNLTVWDAQSMQSTKELHTSEEPNETNDLYCLHAAYDDSALFAAGVDGLIWKWSTKGNSGNNPISLRLDSQVNFLEGSYDNTLLYAATPTGIFVIDQCKWEILGRLETEDAKSIAISENNTRLYVGTSNDKIIIIMNTVNPR